MEKLTRRAALGLGTSAFGLAACTTAAPVTKDAKPFDGSVRFDHGVASGDPLSDSVILWTRVTPDNPDADAIPVSWEIAGADSQRGTVIAKKSRDWCVKVNVGNLQPDTAYQYSFSVDASGETISSETGTTRTTPASGDRPVKLAIVSCSNWQFGRFNAYQSVAEQKDLDAIVHLGDYFYEYGTDGYGGDVAKQIGREHDPKHEIITLDDYRTRHAQYKTDKQLQMAHAAAPWICTWDDHESANDSYRTGAENHNPEKGEGSWSDRKQAALQAYMEWMPVREPEAGNPLSNFWRRFDFGDVASILCLETRLTGRSEEISWFDEVGDVAPQDLPAKVQEVMGRVNSATRTMLGAQQESWLAEELDSSVKGGKTWQVLANQTIMARVRPPNFSQTLSAEQVAAQDFPQIKALVGFSQLGAPLNLDAWDGFPAARERLYAAAATADANLVTLTGDTHTAWVNQLHDAGGERRGVEFGCTSISSPGLGAIIKGVPDLGQQFVDANKEVSMYRPTGHGYTIVSLSRDAVKATFFEVSSILDEEFTTRQVQSFTFPAS